jgi:hypothetical protein
MWVLCSTQLVVLDRRVGVGEGGDDDSPGADDPTYQDEVRVVVEAGKAWTSTL